MVPPCELVINRLQVRRRHFASDIQQLVMRLRVFYSRQKILDIFGISLVRRLGLTHRRRFNFFASWWRSWLLTTKRRLPVFAFDQAGKSECIDMLVRFIFTKSANRTEIAQ